jgi:hypothetical protein
MLSHQFHIPVSDLEVFRRDIPFKDQPKFNEILCPTLFHRHWHPSFRIGKCQIGGLQHPQDLHTSHVRLDPF